jgi:putative ABC transport system permease protein
VTISTIPLAVTPTPDAAPLPAPARLAPGDVLRLGMHGMHTKPLRAMLSALGIAIGIAAVVAVVGIPASSQQALHEQLAKLGTNLLRVQPGDTLTGDKAELPETAVDMARRIGPVQSSSAIGDTRETVRRNDHVPAGDTSGLTVHAATPDLLAVLGGRLRHGTFLNEPTSAYPTTVLGSEAASRLGIEHLDLPQSPQVWIGNQWFTVIGILDPLPLAPEVERSVLVGWSAAKTYLGFTGHPTTLYVTADNDAVEDVRAVLGASVNPRKPHEVKISRPSDALTAQRLAENSYSSLFLGLGGIALLVGGVGVANTMVISVLERRREIGLRRALGATRRQIRGQFLTESVLLSGLGGIAGVLVGVTATAGYALSQGWPAVIPPAAALGGLLAAVAVGAIAGAYPALSAARLTPTEALA